MIKIAAEPLLKYSPCSLDPWMAATYRHIKPSKVPNYTAWWTEAHWSDLVSQICWKIVAL